MTNKLQEYFPMIRTKEEIFKEIQENKRLSGMYYGWTEEEQGHFLDICTGVKGIKLLYDSFLTFLSDWRTEVSRISKYKRSDTSLQGRGRPVIQPIYC